MKILAERPLLLVLAATQFTHALDFMILLPLGPQLMRVLQISPGQFSALVSAYTIGAGLVGLCVAPFMDRFDRRALLLWAYALFVGGTLACGLSKSYATLLAARVICGAFGGVSGSVIMAIVSDVVPVERRAEGIGVVITAFSVAAALGVPLGLFLAQRSGWAMPFLLLAGLGGIIWCVAAWCVPAIRGHLAQVRPHVLREFFGLVRDDNVGRALLFAVAMVFGHFVVIPFLSPYLVSNVGLAERDLIWVYLAGGALTLYTSPVVGRWADRRGLHSVYVRVATAACLITLVLTHAGPMPLWAVLLLTTLFMICGSGRFGPAQAIVSMAAEPRQRGAVMSLFFCTRDLTCGVTTALGGWVVTKDAYGSLLHYNWLGWVGVAISLLSMWLAGRVRLIETRRPA